MSMLVIFVIGYVLGSASALVLVGLMVAGRAGDRAMRHDLEIASHDAGV